jgi:hypothetical protein
VENHPDDLRYLSPIPMRWPSFPCSIQHRRIEMRTNVRLIAKEEATCYLREVGFDIGSWNEIAPAGALAAQPNWLNIQAPRDAKQLLHLSHHAAGWLPRGAWKVVQFDYSNCFTRVENVFISNLLFGSVGFADFNSVERPAILFEFGDDLSQNESLELLIANLVYATLLFEGHAYLVSSASAGGERLGVQDGFLYFQSRTQDASGAADLIERFRRDPTADPQWITEIVIRGQG